MSKKSEKNLFELIKSLTPSEKKSFTLFVNYYSDSEKKYLRLFEIIESQNHYDEKVINQKLREAKILTPLPQIKNYLLYLIFKALRFHYSGKSLEGKIRDHFADLEICHNKGLTTLRDKILKKTKRLSLQNEKHEAFLQILNKEWIYNGDLQKKETILVEQEQVTTKIVSARTYKYLIYSIDKLLKLGAIRDESIQKEWLKIILHPAMLKINEPTDFEENCYYHSIYIIYYEKINDFLKSQHHLEILLKNMESRPDLLMENIGKYMTVLNNFVVVLCANKEMGKGQNVMNKLLHLQNLKLSPGEKSTLVDYIALAHCNLLFGFLLMKKFDAGESIAKNSEMFLIAHNIRVTYKTALFMNLSIYYIYTGNYHAALVWNNSLLNESPENCREDDYAIAKIFSLIIHYELGHNELLPSLVRSACRFLLKRKRLYKIEDAILHFIRNKLPKANSPKELIDFFKELKSELEEISQDAYEAKALEYFDFVTWLESKIQNRPFVDISRKKALQKKSPGSVN